jgi:N-methylhydantoinase A
MTDSSRPAADTDPSRREQPRPAGAPAPARLTPTIVAVDTGGTFTDVVAWYAGELHVHKLPSTPDDPARAVIAGIRHILRADIADVLIHGSTVATNALIERAGARVVLVTNRGFEDVLAIGRQNRPLLYALAQQRPEPLVPAERRLGIAGRIGPRGDVLHPLDAAEVGQLPDRVGQLAPDAVAIVLLHSYAAPDHEQEVAAALQPLGVPLSVSSELLPEYREYERTATTVVNAYVAPLMDGYLGRIEQAARARRVRIMGSAGGAVAMERARRDAAQTILSGPAGGVTGALHVAARHGAADIMTFDMGGTSTDVSLCAGAAQQTREFTIAGLPVALPVLDIHTVGAGGGSIARVDAGGALRVGPESAGARPGPACYGHGGVAATVTDANVVLGRLVPHAHLRLDTAAAAAALGGLAAGLSCSVEAAAEGVIAVVNAAMEGALRVISVERGHDPAAFTLVPFGGAAGLHAVALAERLEIPRLLVPPAPGVLSAYGMLVAPVRKEAARSVLLGGASAAELEPHFAALQETALAAMREEGEPADRVTLRRWVAARYSGQSHELTVPADSWAARFHDAHEQRFGYALRDASVEAVTIGVEASAAAAHIDASRLAAADGAAAVPGIDPPRPGAAAVPGIDPPRTGAAAVPGIDPPLPGAAAASGMADVWHDGRFITASRYDREALRPGHRITGPALLLETTAAFWLPPAWTARVEQDGSLFVER